MINSTFRDFGVLIFPWGHGSTNMWLAHMWYGKSKAIVFWTCVGIKMWYLRWIQLYVDTLHVVCKNMHIKTHHENIWYYMGSFQTSITRSWNYFDMILPKYRALALYTALSQGSICTGTNGSGWKDPSSMARWMNRTKGSKSACLQMSGDGMEPAWVGEQSLKTQDWDV